MTDQTLRPGDYVKFSFVLLREFVVREILREQFPPWAPDVVSVRVDAIAEEPDGTKVLTLSKVDPWTETL